MSASWLVNRLIERWFSGNGNGDGGSMIGERRCLVVELPVLPIPPPGSSLIRLPIPFPCPTALPQVER
jgi:hypothetical protein